MKPDPGPCDWCGHGQLRHAGGRWACYVVGCQCEAFGGDVVHHRRRTWFRLVDAALCADCDAIFAVSASACPACSSQVFTPLSRWLAPQRSA